VIRVATLRDWNEVKEKVIAFNDQYFQIPVDVDKLNAWFLRHLDAGVVLLSEHGLISGLWISDPVRNWDVLAETAWYDTGRDGIRLLREFIEHGRDAGVQEVRMTTLNTTPAGAITLLQRMGFEEIERSHRLTL
jgi:L-amino acid N-acyltransferase YncA